MTSERIKQIQETTAYPQSLSVKQALLQVWNECSQEVSKERKLAEELVKAVELVISLGYVSDILTKPLKNYKQNV